MLVNRRAVTALCCVASSLPWGAQAGGRSIGSVLASNTDINVNSKTSLRLHSTSSSASSRFTSAFVDSSRTFKGLSSSAFDQPAFASSTTSNVIRSYTSNTKLAMSDNIVPQVKNRVALLQLPVTSDKSQNLATAKEYIIKAQQAGAKLCVLPEIWNSPYATSAFREYAEVLPNVDDTLSGDGEGEDWGPSSIMLLEMAMSTRMYIVGGSIPEIRNEKIYNTCLIINPAGRVVGKHRKVHLFDIDVPGGITFKESETLCAGQGATYFDVEESVDEDGNDESSLGRIGVGICYDIRFPEYALLLTQKHQCKILIYPGAFNLTTGPAHWELLQRGRAVDGQCYVLTASPARMPPPSPEDSENKYPHYSAWGHSTVVSPWGEVVATCDEKPGIITADLDMSKVEEMRMAIPTSAQKRHDLYRLVDGDDSK